MGEQIRKQLYISSTLDRVLRRVSRRDNVSESQVLRRALERYFRDEEGEGAIDPILRTIGLVGNDGTGTGSLDHDDIYDRR